MLNYTNNILIKISSDQVLLDQLWVPNKVPRDCRLGPPLQNINKYLQVLLLGGLSVSESGAHEHEHENT